MIGSSERSSAKWARRRLEQEKRQYTFALTDLSILAVSVIDLLLLESCCDQAQSTGKVLIDRL